jgi:hypothetical protein
MKSFKEALNKLSDVMVEEFDVMRQEYRSDIQR